MVQITYCVRYSTKNYKRTLRNFIIVFLSIVIIYIIVSLFVVINVLVPIAVFYCICLISSVFKAITVSKYNVYRSPSKYLIMLGMLLFLLCDICVALSGITLIFPLTNYLISIISEVASSLIWFFYLPSQLLLSLSGGGKIKI